MRAPTKGLLMGILALALLAAACGSTSNASSSSPSSAASSSAPSPTASATESGASPSPSESEGGQITIGSDTANDHGGADVSGKSELSVELDDFYFEPTVISGKPGQSVKLELDNEGQALHNFTLTDQKIDQDVGAGEDGTVTVTIPQSGQLEFFCKYHKTLGMVGALKAP
jgi:plastocyanin